MTKLRVLSLCFCLLCAFAHAQTDSLKTSTDTLKLAKVGNTLKDSLAIGVDTLKLNPKGISLQDSVSVALDTLRLSYKVGDTLRIVLDTALVAALAKSIDSLQTSVDTLKIIAVGDIMMGTDYPNSTYLPAAGEDPFAGVSQLFKTGDIVFGNLEGTLSDTGKNAKHCKDPSKCYSFRSPQKMGTYLKNAGFNVMSIANNHIGDFGKVGIANTMATLSENQIAHAGVYAKPYTFFEKNGVRYGFCAFAPNKDTPKIYDIEAAIATVKKLRDSSDIIMVSFHGGAEGSDHLNVTRKTEHYYGENRGNVYKFAHAMIDAGADVVLGHGPHIVRAVEVYKNKFIAYSLGNFCTYARFNVRGLKGLAPILELRLDASGNFLSGSIHAALQRDRVYPFIDAEQKALKEIMRLTAIDFPETQLNFTEDGSFALKP